MDCCPCGNENCGDEIVAERCPYFRLPFEPGDGRTGPTMSEIDAVTWAEMVRQRPLLAVLK